MLQCTDMIIYNSLLESIRHLARQLGRWAITTAVPSSNLCASGRSNSSRIFSEFSCFPNIILPILSKFQPTLLLLLHCHYSPIRAFDSIMYLIHIPLSLNCSFQFTLFIKTFWGHIYSFPTGIFSLGGVVNPTSNPQPGGPGPIFITPGTGWPSYAPRHRVPILVASYDMHGLQWNYYFIPITTRDNPPPLLSFYSIFRALVVR